MNTLKNKNYYYFCKTLTESIKKNILKYPHINIIYYDNKPNISDENLQAISKFCKKYNIPFFIINNHLLATKIKANGVYLESINRNYKHLSNKKLIIVGSAHNQIEYFIKLRQKCNLIMFSPIFFNQKYSKYKTMGVVKFNLTTRFWKCKAGALGGINQKNLRSLRLISSDNYGVVSLIEKKPAL